jgi:hypothetical protein
MSANLQPEDEPRWRRRFASGANNRAWALSEMASRTREEDDEMLHAAHASAYLWTSIGNEHNTALAHLLLGQVHSLLGNAIAAARFANSSSEYFSSRDSAPEELAFAHAIAANAAHCRGDAISHQAEYAAAQRALEAISNAEEKEIVLATLRVIPKPSGAGASGG